MSEPALNSLKQNPRKQFADSVINQPEMQQKYGT